MTSVLLEDRTRDQLWAGDVIDVDVHATVPSLDALMPHLPAVWKEFIRERGWVAPHGLKTVYAPGLPISARPEWRPQDGRPPASELGLLQEHVLDPWGVSAAVLNCYYAVDSIRHPDFAAALASAVNDWVIAEWLERDPRLRASIVVPARSPEAIVREIDRVGDHPGFVQVMMPVRSDRLYGNRIWNSVYEAIVSHRLVMGIHWGGTTEGPPGPTGWPEHYIEEYAAEWQVYTAQITSLVAEGTFQAFPDLRVSVLEGGFTYLPTWWWRMDKDLKGLRREIPWLDVPPSSVIREHMRFSIAPLDIGSSEDLPLLFEWLGSEDLLMFATDYPHMHDDDVAAFIAATPETMRPKLMADAAREWYRI